MRVRVGVGVGGVGVCVWVGVCVCVCLSVYRLQQLNQSGAQLREEKHMWLLAHALYGYVLRTITICAFFVFLSCHSLVLSSAPGLTHVFRSSKYLCCRHMYNVPSELTFSHFLLLGGVLMFV